MASIQWVRWSTSTRIPTAHLTGDIDLANACDSFDAIREGLTGSEVVVDLSDVTFMGSACLHQLVALGQTHRVRVVAPPGQPLRVLNMAGLGQMFRTFETVEAAQQRHDDA
jgi:anti-anti-sigma factor